MSETIQVTEVTGDHTSVTLDLLEVTDQDGPMQDWREIRPGTARAIAAWYQSPGAVGRVLASFASGMAVDREDLLDDISRTGGQLGWNDELGCLATFVINYGREEE